MLHVVDDEKSIQGALRWMAKSRKLDSTSYCCGEELLEAMNVFLENEPERIRRRRAPFKYDPDGDCVLLDICMPGLSGIATFDRMSAHKLNRRVPVIFITGHGELSIAVDAIKRGAFDFFEKPFNDNRLFDRVFAALALSRKEGQMAVVYRRLDRLTSREKEILDLILVGKMNKVIADNLGISMRTVEVHRANIFDKMEVKSAIELAGIIK